MKRHLSVILLAATALCAASANAAPVFLLQFGSFESRAEADSTLAALKTKHAGVLSRLDTSVREVTLPPDNLTVYRTQAGPLATRADAQSVCSQLASNGDACYVVETAMMPAAAPALAQAAPAEPAPAVVPASAPAAPAVAAAPVPAEPEVAAIAQKTTAPAATTFVPAAVPAPAPVVEAVPATAEPAPVNIDIAPASSVTIPVINRSSSAMDAMSRGAATATPAAPSAMATPAPIVDNEAMQRELAAAAAQQKSGDFHPQPSPFASSAVGVSPATTATDVADAGKIGKAPPAKKRSLWDRMFGSDEQPAPAPAPASETFAAPVEPVAMTAMPAPATPPEPIVVTPPVPMQPATPPAPVVIPAQPQPAMQPAAAPAPSIIMDAAPFPLPPPPAPLTGHDRPQANMAPTPLPTPAPGPTSMTVAPPLPVSAQPNGPAPVLAPQATGAVPVANANVAVEEAKRVPLSQSPAVAAPLPPVAMAPAPAMLPASLSPSATLGQKTLWAEIGPFADDQSALGFWEKYRSQHPDFPVVRVRVASPLQAQMHGNSRVNLRVGPFAREGSINNLCITVASDNLRCGAMTDMGVASDYNHRRGFLPSSRYHR